MEPVISTDPQITQEQQEEFVKLYSQNHGRILSFIRSFAPIKEDADEILQETALVLFRKHSQWDRESASFLTWACGIARNTTRAYLRKRRPQLLLPESVEEKLAQFSIYNFGSEDRDKRLRDALENCLSKLSTLDRQLLTEHYQDRVSVAEIARKQSKATSTTYGLLQSIRARLMACIQRDMEIGPST